MIAQFRGQTHYYSIWRKFEVLVCPPPKRWWTFVCVVRGDPCCTHTYSLDPLDPIHDVWSIDETVKSEMKMLKILFFVLFCCSYGSRMVHAVDTRNVNAGKVIGDFQTGYADQPMGT